MFCFLALQRKVGKLMMMMMTTTVHILKRI